MEDYNKINIMKSPTGRPRKLKTLELNCPYCNLTLVEDNNKKIRCGKCNRFFELNKNNKLTEVRDN